jgi:hypothetical protein
MYELTPTDARGRSDVTQTVAADEPVEPTPSVVAETESVRTETPPVIAEEPSVEEECIDQTELPDEEADYPFADPATSMSQAPLNARHVVLIMLAVVVVAIAVSASVAIFVERQVTSSITTPASNDR